MPQRHKRVKWSKREKERQAKGEKKTEAEKGFGFVETRRSQSGANDGNRKERSDGIARQRKFAAASQKSLNEQERERETSKKAKRKPKPKKASVLLRQRRSLSGANDGNRTHN